MAARRRIRAASGRSRDVRGRHRGRGADTLVPLVPVAIPGGRRFGSGSSEPQREIQTTSRGSRAEPDPPLIGVRSAVRRAGRTVPSRRNPRALVPSPTRSNPRLGFRRRALCRFAACCLLSTLMLLYSRKPPFLSRGSSAPPPSPSSGAIGGSPARSRSRAGRGASPTRAARREGRPRAGDRGFGEAGLFENRRVMREMTFSAEPPLFLFFSSN